MAEDSYGTYSVIDGKQRVTAINNFLTGKFKLQQLEHFQELEGYSFEDLPKEIKNALKIRPYLRVVTLLRQSDNNLKHEVFLRLNKAGVALNNQEIRNVAFRGKFNDLLFDLSENDFLVSRLKSTKTSKIYKEMMDVQYVLRFFTVREMWDKFPGNMDKAMDEFMQKHYQSDDKQVKNFKSQFLTALDTCKEIWGDEAFLKPNATQRVLQGFFDMQMVCVSLLTEAERKNAIKKADKVKAKLKLKLNSKDEKLLKATTQFTSNVQNMEYRIKTFLDILKGV